MRVLHLGNGNLYGGIERFLVSLALMQQRTPVLENHFLLSHEGRLSRELRDRLLTSPELRDSMGAAPARSYASHFDPLRATEELVEVLVPVTSRTPRRAWA